MRPLDGITVVALEQAVSAPFATRQLADLGARVIKVERPGSGDFARGYDNRVEGQSSYFVWLNRSKESLALDLQQGAAREVVEQLISQADVFVQNLAPGAAERLGLSAKVLRARHPRLVVCDLSGYGENGPYGEKKAYDLMVQAESGLLQLTGMPESIARVGFSVVDVAAGMYAYSNILAALLLRARTQQGSCIDVSMLEAIGEWLSNPLYFTYRGAVPAARSGAFHPSIQPYGPFKAGDGGLVMLAVQNEREWAAFCREVLDRPQLANDERFASNVLRTANRTALTECIHAVFATFTCAQIIERIERAGMATARINQIDVLWEHPQLAARDRWRTVDSPAGPIPALLPPGKNDAFEYQMGAVPSVGAHSESILLELGYDVQRIAALRACRAI